MDRKRTVLAAGGVSAVLIAGSTAFAFANGIFETHRVDRVGSFQTIEARLVPHTTPLSGSTTAGAAPPASRGLDVETTVSPPVLVPTGVPTSAPTSAPAVELPATTTVAHSGPSTVPTTHEIDDGGGSTPPQGRQNDD